MRGTTNLQVTMLSSLSPAGHPIRRIKPVVEAALADLEPEFKAMYAATGRHSVHPEQLLKARVLMALYSIRSERQFCERPRYDLLFKFFLDLNVDAEGFDHSTFSKNRERLLKQENADRFFAAVVRQAHVARSAHKMSPASRCAMASSSNVAGLTVGSSATAKTAATAAPMTAPASVRTPISPSGRPARSPSTWASRPISEANWSIIAARSSGTERMSWIRSHCSDTAWVESWSNTVRKAARTA